MRTKSPASEGRPRREEPPSSRRDYSASLLVEPPGVALSSALPWPERVEVLLSAALSLTADHQLDEVLQHIVEGAATVADARYAALGIYDPERRISSFVHTGMDEATVAGIRHLPRGEGLLGEVIVAQGPIHLHDLTADRRSCGFPPGHPAMHTFLGVPIVRQGRRYGNLYLTEKRGGGDFTGEDEALVVSLAAFAAGAIESAQLVESEWARAEAAARAAAAEERAQVRREMLAEVINAQEAERARVARDLHDDVGQALTSVLLGLHLVDGSLAGPEVDVDEARRRTVELRTLVADALRRARQLAFDLRPTVLDDVGLVPALQRLTEEVGARAHLSATLHTPGIDPDVRFPVEIETVIYRVVQEALTNVVRHAHASSADVTLTMVGSRARAVVDDDGVGFDPAAPKTRPHLGLVGMAERAELVGATVEVSSSPGAGTTVMLDVPVE